MSYLDRVFRKIGDDNRRAILDRLPARRGGAVLDVGCNAGELTARIARRLGATRVAGVELLEEHAQAAPAPQASVRIDRTTRRSLSRCCGRL